MPGLQAFYTRTTSLIAAFLPDSASAMIYELSRGLHWEINRRADRFGPIRISLLQ